MSLLQYINAEQIIFVAFEIAKILERTVHDVYAMRLGELWNICTSREGEFLFTNEMRSTIMYQFSKFGGKVIPFIPNKANHHISLTLLYYLFVHKGENKYIPLKLLIRQPSDDDFVAEFSKEGEFIICHNEYLGRIIFSFIQKINTD